MVIKSSIGLIISFLCISICDILMYLSWDGFGPGWVTYAVMPLKLFALFILIFIASKQKWLNLIPSPILFIFVALISWNILTVIRGSIYATDYYDWKFLMDTSFFFLMIPLALVIGIYPLYIQRILSFTLKYLFLFGFILIPLAASTNTQLYSRLMVPVGVLILLIPFVKPKWRVLIITVAIISILSSIAFRTNIIRITVAFLLVLVYYFQKYLKVYFIKLLHILLFIAPAIFLYLALIGQFNILNFKEKDSEFEMTDNRGGTRNLFVDNRTFLYVEVISSLINDNSFVVGKGATGKYQTDFYDFGDNRGRYMSEVGFLNTLLFSGILGVIIYFAFLFTVSYYAIYKSNSYLSKIFGLFIAFRWNLFFIEEFTLFDLNFFFYWILLGVISSKTFRSMNDSDLADYLKLI